MKEIILKRDGVFSVSGGILVAGDTSAYTLKIDMEEPTKNFTAMAVCQENGNYSTNFSTSGTYISCGLVNSMYSNEGFITIRFIISKNSSVLTVKEVIFRVVASNNSETLGTTEKGNIEKILTAVAEMKEAASVFSTSNTLSGLGITDAYTKSETDEKISSAITSALNTEV